MMLAKIHTIVTLAAIIAVLLSGCVEEEGSSFALNETITVDDIGSSELSSNAAYASTAAPMIKNIGSNEGSGDGVFASATTPAETLISTPTPLTSSISEEHIQANGMILSIPMESDLKSYISDQGISVPVDVYAYLFYRMDGVYLIVTDDTDVDKEITSADVIGKLYSIDFDAVDVPDDFRSLQCG